MLIYIYIINEFMHRVHKSILIYNSTGETILNS